MLYFKTPKPLPGYGMNDHLEVTDPEIEVLFLGKEIETPDGPAKLIGTNSQDGLYRFQYMFSDGDWHWFFSIRIPKATVKKVCEQKEGEAWFILSSQETFDTHDEPIYGHKWRKHFTAKGIKANALTIGKTIGELRELWRWLND